ncbi:CHAD domain-containing protein [Streptomyces sp. PR69]|uniref:CHAD domain-containing protein n=1 Tax=Streptomyces sp. PR69 TaxID=2984950 RepID=UPI003A5C51F0
MIEPRSTGGGDPAGFPGLEVREAPEALEALEALEPLEAVTAGEALGRYLHAQAGDFLRSLRLHGESGSDTAATAEAALALRMAARRIGGTLQTFRPLLDPVWADELRAELAWLSATLAQEHACISRLSRLLDALSRLSGAVPLPPARAELTLPPSGGAAARKGDPAREAPQAQGAQGAQGADAGSAAAGAQARQGAGSSGSAAPGGSRDGGAPSAQETATGGPGDTGGTGSAAAGADAAGGRAGIGAVPETTSSGAHEPTATGHADGRTPPGTHEPTATGNTTTQATPKATAPGAHEPTATGHADGRTPPGAHEPTATGNTATPKAAASHTRQPVTPAARATAPNAHGRTTAGTGSLTVGAARAGALLERQLTLARTRAHSAALQALGSSRFHAVADAVAVLASELPLTPAAGASAAEALVRPAQLAERLLLDAVAALPLARAAHPYNAEALVHGLSAPPAGEAQDAPWHQVRQLLRLHRYAREVLHPQTADPVLGQAGRVLDRHRDAAEAAAAAAAAARTPRIAPATAYALGVLHADQRHEVEAARFAFQQVWQQTAAAAPATVS